MACWCIPKALFPLNSKIQERVRSSNNIWYFSHWQVIPNPVFSFKVVLTIWCYSSKLSKIYVQRDRVRFEIPQCLQCLPFLFTHSNSKHMLQYKSTFKFLTSDPEGCSPREIWFVIECTAVVCLIEDKFSAGWTPGWWPSCLCWRCILMPATKTATKVQLLFSACMYMYNYHTCMSYKPENREAIHRICVVHWLAKVMSFFFCYWGKKWAEDLSVNNCRQDCTDLIIGIIQLGAAERHGSYRCLPTAGIAELMGEYHTQYV